VSDLPLLVIERLTLLEKLLDKTEELSRTSLASNTSKVPHEVRNEFLRVIQKTRRIFLRVPVGLTSLKLFVERHDEERSVCREKTNPTFFTGISSLHPLYQICHL